MHGLFSGKEYYDNQNLVIDGEDVETVSNFCYLGAFFTDCYDTKEIKQRIAIAKIAVVSLAKVWKNNLISLKTKLQIRKCLVLSKATYGVEYWVMNDSGHKKINAFELWAYPQLLCIKWVEMHTKNESLAGLDKSHVYYSIWIDGSSHLLAM